MTFRLSDEERGIVLQTLKSRLDALHAEMTRTDSPEFNIQLKHEEDIDLVRRIVFRRHEDGAHEFSGRASLSRVLAGVVGTKAGVAFQP